VAGTEGWRNPVWFNQRKAKLMDNTQLIILIIVLLILFGGRRVFLYPPAVRSVRGFSAPLLAHRPWGSRRNMS
jgi:hypothetical protein